MLDTGACHVVFCGPSGVAYVTPPEGKILHSLEIKRLVDLGMLAACTVQYYEPSTKEIISRDATQFSQSIDGYMRGDLVLAYKF